MVLHWSLSDSKSPQVSRTRLSILAVLSNGVIWIVSTSPPTSKSSRPLLLLFYSFKFFSHQCSLMVFHWSLSDCKSPQVSRTRLSILADLSNAVIWIVSTSPPTSKSSRPFNNPLVIVPKAPITIGTIVTFTFHIFFNSLARSRYLSFFSLSFRFILWSAKSTILQIFFFFFWPGLGDLFVC